jgi:hypothetical protein
MPKNVYIQKLFVYKLKEISHTKHDKIGYHPIHYTQLGIKLNYGNRPNIK